MGSSIGKIVFLISFTAILNGCTNTKSNVDIKSCKNYGVRQPAHNCGGPPQNRPQGITVTAGSISVSTEPLATCPGDTLVFTADPITTEFAILFNASKWPGRSVGPNDIWATNGVLDLRIIGSQARDCVGYSVIVKDKANQSVRGLDPVLIIDY